MKPHAPQHHDPELDLRITRALSAVPAVRIPDGFSQRVVANLPAQSLVSPSGVTAPDVARRVTYVAAAALLLAMLFVARLAQAPGHLDAVAHTIAQYTFAAEFVLLTLWLTVRTRLSR